MRGSAKNLKYMFNPKSVAIVGASDNPGKLGFHVMKSLTQNDYEGTLLPVNPGSKEIRGFRAFPSLLEIPEPVDLVIVVVPSKHVPDVIQQCAKKRVKGVVLVTAGFSEIDAQEGLVLQRKIADMANQSNIPIIGPNTYGFVNSNLGLNATFTPEFLQERGNIALVTQSGGMAGIITNASRSNRVGFSKIIGVGNRCNIDFGDIVEYLVGDPETDVIGIYMEGTEDPRFLIEIAKNRKNYKPIVVYKVGRFSGSDRASKSHTGSIAGNHEIYQGAFRQGGILFVESSDELLDTSKILSKSVLPKGESVAILSAQAGPGIAASDICEARGLSIPAFSGRTKKTIEELLPPLALRTNPVDMALAWYDMHLTNKIIQTVVEDPVIGAIMFIFVYGSANINAVRGMSEDLLASRDKKPIVTCISAPYQIWDKEIEMLEKGGITNYPNPERAAKALSSLFKYSQWKESST